MHIGTITDLDPMTSHSNTNRDRWTDTKMTMYNSKGHWLYTQEGPDVSGPSSTSSRWKQGQLTPEAPGRETLGLPSGTHDLPT